MDLLHPADWVIFALMVVGTLAIGIYHAVVGRRNQTTSEYLTGNRKLLTIPVSISLNASVFSAVLIVGLPAENYVYGGIFWYNVIGHCIGAILSVIIFVPVFHPLGLTSVNEYLQLRYKSRFVAILGTLSGVTSMCLYTAIVFFAPATVFHLVTGLPTWASILIWTVITVLYTSIGGIKGVIWTDVFQAFLMIIGMLTITITAAMRLGGISEVWKECSKWGRLNFGNVDPDPTVRLTFWSLSIGIGALGMIRYGTDQAAVQRYCSVPSLGRARLCVLSIIPWTVVAMCLTSLTGLSVFAFYSRLGCDPLGGRLISNPNQLISRFVLDTLDHPGIHGILLASIVAASLSTASSNLNSSSANIWKDVLLVIWPNLHERQNVIITKVLVVCVGVVSMCLGFGASALGGTVIQMTITFTSACGAPAMTMFLVGIFLPFINWIGAAIGGLIGFAYALWMGFGGYIVNNNARLLSPTANCSQYAATYLSRVQMTTLASLPRPTDDGGLDPSLRRFYSLSYLWIALFTSLVTLAAAIIISLLTGGFRNKVPKQLLHPWIRHFCGHLEDAGELIKDENGGDMKKEKNPDGKKNQEIDNPLFVTHL